MRTLGRERWSCLARIGRVFGQRVIEGGRCKDDGEVTHRFLPLIVRELTEGQASA